MTSKAGLKPRLKALFNQYTYTPLEITAAGARLTRISVSTLNGWLLQNGPTFPSVVRQLVRDEYCIYFSSDIGASVAAIISRVAAENDALIDLRVERPSLEDRFIELTNTGAAR